MPVEETDSLFSEKDAVASFNPLPCDRWIARSCLQKAIRRGNGELAVRALANLFLYDPKAVWRHLTIIVLEDVGVAGIPMLSRIIAAKFQHQATRRPGLLWKTCVDLTRRVAGSDHSQAICDLLLRVENDPALLQDSNELIETGPLKWSEALYDPSAMVERRAVAALCFGGFMDLRGSADPSAVFEICSETGCSEVAEIARGAWKLSRNPMALLLPVLWQASRRWTGARAMDDTMPPGETISGVPEYALDQFTRIGKSVSRALVEDDPELQMILAAATVSKFEWPKVVGDLIFLLEGGRCVRRATWEEAEALRSPERWLPGTAVLGGALQPAMEHLASRRCQLRNLRQQLFQRAVAASV